jgi:stage V sporulation protein AD
MAVRIGKTTIELENPPRIIGYAAYVGKKEREGPLARYFKHGDSDTTFGEDSWEKAESELQRRAFKLAAVSAGVAEDGIDIVFGGDLLNQCVASAYASRGSSLPFVGLYGACSTMAESLALAAIFADSGCAERAAAITSSHFCAAERQFRFPLEYGGQRTPSAQWTVTGSGCVIVGRRGAGRARVKQVCFGAVADLEVTDINNMGSAMAPAAAATLSGFFRDTGTAAEDYGAVVTGDLGEVGSQLLEKLCEMEGYKLPNHLDCGKLIFDSAGQEVGAGGSGCGCSASVLTAYFLPMLERGELRDILFMATGALMSPTSFQQGESIPSIAHLVHITAEQ